MSRAVAATLLLALSSMIAAAGCTPFKEERSGASSAEISGSEIGTVKITHYTLARESDFASESDFLCSGRGVAMQGTGIRNDGTYVKYVSGGGGWCGGYARLCNCPSAKFTTVSGVIGASGRTLTKGYSIAVDPKRIPLGSYVWLSALGHWFRADDTGGAIIGLHVDIYAADSSPSLPPSSRAFVTSEEHGVDDPGPNGEAASPPLFGDGDGNGNEPPSSPPASPTGPSTPPTPTERPTQGPFEALDVRYPIGPASWITQCTEDATAERAWITMSSGKDALSRWADPKHEQSPSASCGAPTGGHYPLVLRGEPAQTLGGTWITQCVSPGVARVFKVNGGDDNSVDGHPMAAFLYNEPDVACDEKK